MLSSHHLRSATNTTPCQKYLKDFYIAFSYTFVGKNSLRHPSKCMCVHSDLHGHIPNLPLLWQPPSSHSVVAVLCYQAFSFWKAEYLWFWRKAEIYNSLLITWRGNVDAVKNDYVCIEINIPVTVVICYPNHVEPKLTRASVTQVCWQMAAV